MTGHPHLDRLFADLDQFIRHASERAEALPPCREKELLSATITRLREARDGADVQVGAAIDWMKAVGETQLAKVKGIEAEIARVRADLAAAAAKAAHEAGVQQAARAAAVVQAAMPALDPLLGKKLRDELLKQFGPADPTPEPPRTGKDIWENWE
ncbi:MAG: hypothetical protein LC104_18775 [Bacteroidales bacterium]|nr:hypothetical protein [Bacteroidales bacterium]